MVFSVVSSLESPVAIRARVQGDTFHTSQPVYRLGWHLLAFTRFSFFLGGLYLSVLLTHHFLFA